jgi:MFS family permease
MLHILHDPTLMPSHKSVSNTIALFTTCFVSFLDVLNLTAVNIAVPLTAQNIGLTTTTLPWLMAGYSIDIAPFLLPAGKLGDMYGYRMVYLIGITLFA